MTTTLIRTAVTASAVAATVLLSGCGALALKSNDVAGTPTFTTTTTAPTTATTTAAPILVPNPTTQRAPVGETTAQVADSQAAKVNAILHDVDKLWESVTGLTISADVHPINSVSDASGVCDDVRSAAVCDQAGSASPLIEWNRQGISRIQKAGGDTALALLLSHEYGHVLLERTGHDSGGDPKEERTAWCLAGAYMSVGGPKWGTSDELWNSAFDATSWDGESARSKEIRRDMVNLGFEVPDNDPLGWCVAKS